MSSMVFGRLVLSRRGNTKVGTVDSLFFYPRLERRIDSILFGVVFAGWWFEEHLAVASIRHKSRVVTLHRVLLSYHEPRQL